jgi:hypothetical protein
MKTFLWLCLLFLFLSIPVSSYAQVKFGGRATFRIPCSCTGGAYSAFFFSPLYLNSAVPTSGFITVPTTGTNYPSYFLSVGRWALGSYTPGTQVCLMTGTPCFVYPTIGVMGRATGISL